MCAIRDKFGDINDLRHQGYIEHKLSDVLIIVMCAVLCGLDELGDILLFAQSRLKLLTERFGIEKIPSKPTLSRILSMVDGEAVGKAIVEIMKEMAGTDGDIVAVDGKSICRTHKDGYPHSALQILTAYLTESGVVLGQQSIQSKTNEIPVFQDMLDYLDVSDKIITADAMHCQKETCHKIVHKGGNYVFGLKENHKLLYDDIKLYLSDSFNSDILETYRTIEKNAGRIEERICRKIADLSWLDCREDWAGLCSVFEVRRITETKKGQSEETRYYISSLKESAERLLNISREHWKIESLHWMLDVVFSEDDCKILSENGHKTLNSFRKLALLIHKRFIAEHRKKTTVKAHLLSCLLDETLLKRVCENL